MDETDIDDGRRPGATVNGESEFIHSRLLVCPLGRIRDTMVLVLSSRGMIYKQNLVSK